LNVYLERDGVSLTHPAGTGYAGNRQIGLSSALKEPDAAASQKIRRGFADVLDLPVAHDDQWPIGGRGSEERRREQ
jgi:hypothetical protein